MIRAPRRNRTSTGDEERYTETMRTALLAAVLLAISSGAAGQDRKVPDDSIRISIPGCSKGRTFIVVRTPGHEPVRSDVAPGRRFRLSGKKALLQEIKKHEGTTIEVTGLVRQSQVAGPGGVAIGGARISGGPPQAPTGSPIYQGTPVEQAVIDVESWRLLSEPCPRR